MAEQSALDRILLPLSYGYYLSEDTRAEARTELDGLRSRIQSLESALIRLRDCDFVITPADRMDAVREIAREALKT